ncbi:hypothetical protein [Ferruginibacter albus]|uniref:hypothetical protein n=1 Tax=Ferruginibacter albus TaxID=2875540 RepID=UPI001CC473ED|nr:hypothetical protein [Ferruginibacter albus]UAY51985.1 hypothetical protein K9M53_15505 [Ferruginibacter albus]
MELHLKIIGWLLLVLSGIHVFFPKYFNWKQELSLVSAINRQMMNVHTFFIALILLLMSLLCISSANELATTMLGRRICFGLGIFWLIRLLIQFFGYSSKLWKGKAFETSIHTVFSILWLYFSGVFFYVCLR